MRLTKKPVSISAVNVTQVIYQGSFYIGDVKQEDVKAAFKNGILSISVPKEDKKAKEEKKYITIGE